GRILRGQKDAPGVLGDTGKAFVRLVIKVEADHMGGEVYPLAGEFPGERAGVCVAGFDTIGDQHDRRRVIAVGERFGGMPDGRRDRSLAFRSYRIDAVDEASPVERPRIDQGLDVPAISLRPMAISHKADIAGVRPAAYQV